MTDAEMSPAAAGSGDVSIVIRDRVISIDDPPPCVADVLLCGQIAYVPGGRFGYRAETQGFSYCDMEPGPPPRLSALVGLLPRICRALRHHGYRPLVTDKSQPLTPLIVEGAGLSAADTAFVRAVGRHRRGQIDTPRLQQLVAYLVALVKACPTGRIVIVASRMRFARWLQRRLVAELRIYGMGLVHSRALAGVLERIAICTPQYLYPYSTARLAMLLIVEAAEAIGLVQDWRLARMNAERVYGFRRIKRVLVGAEALSAERLMGRVIWRQAQSSPRPVSFSALSAPSPHDCPAWGWRAKREIWSHPQRNRLIADLATAAAKNDRDAMAELGILPEGPHATPASAAGVAVVVESEEHARHLRALLPGWPVLTADGGRPSQCPDGIGYIVTTTYLALGDHRPPIHICIRADGSSGTLHLPRPRTKGETTLATVIDIADDLDAIATQHALQRLRQYRRAGWTVIFRRGDADAHPDIPSGDEHGNRRHPRTPDPDCPKDGPRSRRRHTQMGKPRRRRNYREEPTDSTATSRQKPQPGEPSHPDAAQASDARPTARHVDPSHGNPHLPGSRPYPNTPGKEAPTHY